MLESLSVIELPDGLTVAVRLLNIILGCVALYVMWRTLQKEKPELNLKGHLTYIVMISTAFLSAYGSAEQMAQGAPGGLRAIGTTAVLGLMVYLVRLPGGTRD